MAIGKRTKKAREGIDREKAYSITEAVKLVKERAKAKFDETIEIAMNLGVDPTHADQMVRGVVTLPNGSGRTLRVGVFARGAKADEAKAAGAAAANVDYVVAVGTMLGEHYRVVEAMGKGSFGQVVSAEDVRTHVKVAIKVIKNREAFRRQARTEIRLLEVLNRKDPDDQWCIGE